MPDPLIVTEIVRDLHVVETGDVCVDAAEVVSESVVIEELIPGPPGASGIDRYTAEDIATAEATEVRVDCDALVAALLSI